MVTRWEVEKAVGTSRLEPIGRVIMLTLLTLTRWETAEIPPTYAPTFTDLERLTGCSRSTLTEWMKALSDADWVSRKSFPGESRLGFVLGVGSAQLVRPIRERKPKNAKRQSPVPPGGTAGLPDETAGKEKNIDEAYRPAVQDEPPAVPPSGTRRTAQRYATVPPGGTPAEAPIRNLPTGDAVPATTTPPTPPTPTAINEPSTTDKWPTTNRQTSPSVGAHNTAKPQSRQPAMFTPTKTLPEAIRIILDGLHTAGYPHATEADARAVHTAIRTKHGHKVVPNYLRTMAANQSFTPFFDTVREQRREQVEQQIRTIQADNPDCEHGLSGGNMPHPATGQMLCPSCRNGTPSPQERIRRRTHPAITGALDAYRTAGGTLTAAVLLRLSHELNVLHSKGATAQQLAEIATAAAGTLQPAAAT